VDAETSIVHHKCLVLLLAHLTIDVGISSCLKDLMPLLGFRIELVHVVSPAIRVSSRKKIEEPPVLDHRMPGSWGIDNFIIRFLVLILGHSPDSSPLFAFFVVHILF